MNLEKDLQMLLRLESSKVDTDFAADWVANAISPEDIMERNGFGAVTLGVRHENLELFKSSVLGKLLESIADFSPDEEGFVWFDEANFESDFKIHDVEESADGDWNISFTQFVELNLLVGSEPLEHLQQLVLETVGRDLALIWDFESVKITKVTGALSSGDGSQVLAESVWLDSVDPIVEVVGPSSRQSPTAETKDEVMAGLTLAKFCTECGTKFGEGSAKFCSECGARR